MSHALASKPLGEFLTELASAEPLPGGGSVAAFSGALAASLIAMVCRLTIDKKGYESVRQDMERILSQVEPLQQELLGMMQGDMDAYAQVMDAYKLPKTTDAERAQRTEGIQQALKQAASAPLAVAERCLQVLELACEAVSKGNRNAASDAGVGGLMAEAGLRGAGLNVMINLAGIKDADYVSAQRARLAQLEAQADKCRREILKTLEAQM